jgi:hypothetical protein
MKGTIQGSFSDEKGMRIEDLCGHLVIAMNLNVAFADKSALVKM